MGRGEPESQEVPPPHTRLWRGELGVLGRVLSICPSCRQPSRWHNGERGPALVQRGRAGTFSEPLSAAPSAVPCSSLVRRGFVKG